MKQKKIDIIKSLSLHSKDVGSTEVQIGLLSSKIEKLSEHFKKNKKDNHSNKGLTDSVNKRKKLLTYLKRKNLESYNKVLKQLNLRK
jgi:small subunit ribosomal protein S15|tara:strand:- start:810 stop:1070 length:261 start_codon:yes stop_codon:yes gene_type:complete